MPDTGKWLTKRALNFIRSQHKVEQQASITSHQQKSIKFIWNNLKIHIFPITKFALTQLNLANLIQILNLFSVFYAQPKIKIFLGCDTRSLWKIDTLEYSRVKATSVSVRLRIFLFAFKIPNICSEFFSFFLLISNFCFDRRSLAPDLHCWWTTLLLVATKQHE